MYFISQRGRTYIVVFFYEGVKSSFCHWSMACKLALEVVAVPIRPEVGPLLHK